MKRKLTSGIFALAALLTASSAFYSCKDYDEELTADYSSKITTLKDALEPRVATAETDIDNLQTDVANLQDSASVHAGEIATLKTQLSKVKEDVSDLTSDFGDLKVQVSSDSSKIVVLQQDYETLKSKVHVSDSTVEVINTTLGTITSTTLPSLQTKIDDAVVDLSGLTKRIDCIENMLKEMVTSIAVRAVESPVVGSLIYPVDVQSNILAAYYGQNLSAINFPTAALPNSIADADAKALWNTTEAKTNAKYYGAESATNAYFAEAGDTLLSNAGTVYMNINPSTVDFEGKFVQLVNSQNENGGITLSPVTKSDKVLTFGYSRAAGNQLYASDATVTDLAKAKFVISDDAKAAVSQLKNAKTNGINFKNLASQLQSAMTDLGDVYDVQAAWYDTDTLGVKTPHYVASETNIGAYAVKPLSYTFLEGKTFSGVTVNGKTYTEIPGIDAIKAKLNNAMDKALDVEKIRLFENSNGAQVRLYFDLNDPDVQSNLDKLPSSMANYVAETYVGSVEFEGDSYDAYLTFKYDTDTNGDNVINYRDTKHWMVYVDYPVDNLSSELQSSITDYINKVKNKVQSAEDKVAPYYTKVQNFANKALNYVKEPNALLQPVALYANNEGGYSSLSAVKSLPTHFDAASGKSLTIYPTSYTSELLAPAFKKYVAVLGYEKVGNNDAKEAVADTNKCQKYCKCHLDEFFNADGTPAFVEVDANGDSIAHCHPNMNGDWGHKLGDATCDNSYCTCTPGYCPNVWCLNHFDHGVYHSSAKPAQPETYSDKPVVKQQGVFDGNIRTYEIKDLKAGKYTIIYQALDYAGNIKTKYYYIVVE